MSQKVYLYILKGGVLASFFCVLFVFKGLLFPFITSKQLPFNILMELMLVIWLAFIIKFPQWNPFGKFAGKATKNLVTWGLFAFFGALIASLFVSVDFNLSMWGDIERMLGVFHILHFAVLYVVAITVFRDKKDWKIALITLLSVAVLVALQGTKDSKSTIGNNAYTAAFMLFASWFAFILFFFEQSSGKKNLHWQWVYFLFVPLLLFVMKLSDTGGAFVGTGIGFMVFFFLFAVTNKIKKVRMAAWAILTLFIGFIAVYYANINNPSFPKINILTNISFQKNTFQTRLISWEGAWKDFKNHPALGVGNGNYAIIFDKYFQAKFYDYSRGETYFDRAHNNLIDIASTSGAVGLLTYLSIFVFVAIYLFKAYRRGRINGVEFALWSSLFVAYFVQNLVVFDSFVTYLCLMIVLGYVYWIANTNENDGNEKALLSIGGESGLVNKELYTFIVVGAFSLFLIFQYNISVWSMLNGVIKGQQMIGSGNFELGFTSYQDALSKNTVLDRDGRSMYLRAFAARPASMTSLSPDKLQKVIDFSINMAQKNLAYNSKDSMMQMEMARTYDTAAKLVKDEAKSREYAQKALDAIDASIAASKSRIPLYFIQAQFLVGLGRIDEAVAGLEYANTLNLKFYETSCQLAQIYILKANGKGEDKTALRAKGYTNMDKCLTNGGGDLLAVESVITDAVNYYSEKKDLEKVLQLYEQLINFRQKDPAIWKNLALLYAQAGNKDRAAKAANVAAQLDPKLKADVEQFIKQLNNQ